MKTLAVFLGLMVAGTSVVVLYLLSGESLIVLTLILLTILIALWIFQQRPWTASQRSQPAASKGPAASKRPEATTARAFEHQWNPILSATRSQEIADHFDPRPTKSAGDELGQANDAPVPPSRDKRVRYQADHASNLVDDSSAKATNMTTAADTGPGEDSVAKAAESASTNTSTSTSTSTAGNKNREQIDEPEAGSTTDKPSPKRVAAVASHLRERVFGRKRAVFDLEGKEDFDRLWWDGHVGTDHVEKRPTNLAPPTNTAPEVAGKPSSGGSPQMAQFRSTGKIERPLGPAEQTSTVGTFDLRRVPLEGSQFRRQLDLRTDTIELRSPKFTPLVPPAAKSVASRETVPQRPAQFKGSSTQFQDDPTPFDDNRTQFEGYKVEPERPEPKPVPAEGHPEWFQPIPKNNPDETAPHDRVEDLVTEIRPARAAYDINCDKKGISGVPQNQQAPQLWAWQQISEMGLDIDPLTGLMALRLGFPNLRNPNEPAYDWLGFGPVQDPDQVMDEARAGWRVSKIPRSQFFYLSPGDRTRQLKTFLAAKEISTPGQSDDAQLIFRHIRAELMRHGGLVQLSPDARLAEVLNCFGQLLEIHRVDPLAGNEIAELEALGSTSTLPEVYWSLDWFMERRDKRIAFVDEHRSDYLFGLIPANLADDWDGQTVGAGATVILDIP